MRYFSTNGSTEPVSARTAVLSGLAPDGGLYMPSQLPPMPPSFIESLEQLSLPEVGTVVAAPYFEDDISYQDIEQIVHSAITFDAPLVQLGDNLACLELFHGPTLAFKDFGARFMAQVMAYFARHASNNLTVLVATSGDTGSAVAQGFHDVEGVTVVLLYPEGKVSTIQEKQLTTVGGNVHALRVQGTFDDCQALVKQAFSDAALTNSCQLTSANSINIARLIPQTFYYFAAAGKLARSDRPLWIVVPSGNFGNLTAGLIAKHMGLPITRFVAATNANDVVPHYLRTSQFAPRPSLQTLSNAMDVGNPSNFARMQALAEIRGIRLQDEIVGAVVTDETTLEAIHTMYRDHAYTADPHTAVGYAAALQQMPDDAFGVFLATAHPAKFIDIVERATASTVQLPPRLAECLSKQTRSVPIKARFDALREYLMDIRTAT